MRGSSVEVCAGDSFTCQRKNSKAKQSLRVQDSSHRRCESDSVREELDKSVGQSGLAR